MAVTQGPFAAGGVGSVHPATPQGAVCTTMGCPMTSTFGTTLMGLAWPRWEQVTPAFRCNKNPGMFFPLVPDYLTVKAPLLMVTTPLAIAMPPPLPSLITI